MTDEILGSNPLEARDSIWKVPAPQASPAPAEPEEIEDELDFPDPLARNDEPKSVIPPTESPSQEPPLETDESSDYFEVPNYDAEALTDEEQDVLHEELPENDSLNEEFLKTFDSTGKAEFEPEPAIELPAAPAPQEAAASMPEPEFYCSISVQELDPILSDGAEPTTLDFDADFPSKLVSQIKATLPRDEESAGLFAKYEGLAAAPAPEAEMPKEPQDAAETLPVLAEEEVASPEIEMDDKVVTENLANMMTLEDLILDGGQQGSPQESPSQASMPITVDNLPGSTPQGINSMDINSYIINNDLPAPPSSNESLPQIRDEQAALDLAQNTFRKNEEDEDTTRLTESSYTSIMQLVGFKLDTEFYGIDIMQIQEIIRLQDVTPVPRSANFILGVLNLRGKVIPIIDLRRRFSLPKAFSSSQTRIVIVNIDVGVIGFVVDEVTEVIRMPKSALETAPATATNINAEYIKGVGHLGDTGEELLIILDLNKVLTKDRKELVEELL